MTGKNCKLDTAVDELNVMNYNNNKSFQHRGEDMMSQTVTNLCKYSKCSTMNHEMLIPHAS